ncbi:MAG: hypothetical protein HYR64_05940 [Fimbriimonas ginsengisoli]|uniref:Uncharacterized protein n=1 Tax=Fimbriimonas ginsengisoli TaxID=1005039 RepID=A0A931PWG8_FIMGI|nr:hypothetical protein [Fimbriimonas ginsengisoli]
MKRPSKKDIAAAVDKLKDKSAGSFSAREPNVGKLSSKKSSQRIRKKQGV